MFANVVRHAVVTVQLSAMSLEATDTERRLRANRDAFVLKEHVSGKSEAW